MKRIAVLAIALAVAATAAFAAEESAEKPKAAVLNFYLLDRVPRDALSDTVVLSGDNYFTNERFGLENTLRRLFNETLRKNSDLKMKAATPPSIPDESLEAPFLYWAKSDNPADYFDKNLIAEHAKELDVDYLIVGMVEKLSITKAPKSMSDESVAMKVDVLVFETATGTFIQTKTYEKESKQVNGLPDFERLPEKSGSVPYDFTKFAESEAGRVFLDMLPQMIADIPGGKTPDPFLSGAYMVAGGKTPTKEAHVVSGSDTAETVSAADLPECGNASLAVLTSIAGKNTGVRIYNCADQSYNFDNPAAETKTFASTKKGVGSMATGDFDGDGIDELAATPLDAGEFVKFYKFEGGTFDPAQPWQTISDIIPGVSLGLRAAAGDFDGDGTDELAVTADRGGDFTVFVKYAADHFEPMANETQLFNVFETSKFGSYIAAGDFDGDGKAELAVSSMDGGVSIRAYRYKDGQFDASDPLAKLSADWGGDFKGARVDAGDFDGDGKAELAVSTTGGDGYLWIFKYDKGRFLLSKPYLDSAYLYDNAPYGIVTTIGRFNR